ncbi:MAG: hypothetical protein ACXVAU_18595, partial [Mucilaginibacter sp.]
YFTGAKDGNLYLLDKDNMGGFSYTGNKVLQTVPVGGGLHAQPTYYSDGTNEYVYVWSEGDQLRQLTFNRGSKSFASTQILGGGGPGYPGAAMSVSSNGTVKGTGVLWAAYQASGTPNYYSGILAAYDASNVTRLLWESNDRTEDAVGFNAKFSSPTVANGHVYLATFSNTVVVYGLR